MVREGSIRGLAERLRLLISHAVRLRASAATPVRTWWRAHIELFQKGRLMIGSEIRVPQVVDVAYDGLSSVVAYAVVESPMWAHP